MMSPASLLLSAMITGVLHISKTDGQCSDFVGIREIIVTPTFGYSIDFPSGRNNYQPNQVCEWQFQTSVDGHVIRITITDSSIQGRDIREECNTDYVDIFDVIDNRKVYLNRFCGRETGQKYVSSASDIIVVFTANYAFEYAGFKANVEAIPQSESPRSVRETDNSLSVSIAIPICILVLSVAMAAVLWWHRRQKMAALRQAVEAQRGADPFVHRSQGHPSHQRSGHSAQGPPPLGHELSTSYHPDDTTRFDPPPAYEAVAYTSPSAPTLPITPPSYEDAMKDSTTNPTVPQS